MPSRILVAPPASMPARILVTGAQGFIGRYVAAHCLAADPEAAVVGIGRSRPLADAFTHRVEWAGARVAAPLPDALRHAAASGRYRYQRLDVRDTAGVLDLVRGFVPTAVIHLSGALRDEATDRLLQLNVLGTESLYEAIAGAGIAPPTVVLGSSGSIYGARPHGSLPVAPGSGDAPADLYAVSKLAAEHTARVLAARHGVPTVCARIFCVAGPGQEERHLCGWLARQVAEIRAGHRAPVVHAGPLDTSRDFVDVRDVARALHLLAWRGVPGRCYNVASGVETRGEEVYGHLLGLAGVAGGVERSVAPRRPADVPRMVADIGALRALGWAPQVPLRDTLADLLAYYAQAVAPLGAASARAAGTGGATTGSGDEDGARPGGGMHVSNQRSHSYPVHVREGLMDELPDALARRYPGTRMVVLTDDRVEALFAAPLVEAMRARGIFVEPVVVPEGEGSKSAAVLLDLVGRLYAAGFDRRGLLVNVGGGLVTDLGGFAAAVYMRGVRYLNVPTTLLAQNDAAVGGKVAVNTPWAKNFLGAFHDPEAVFCDPGVLRTLPRRALAAGVAESIKVALCGDPALFGILERQAHAILVDRDPGVLGEVVRRSIDVKIRLLDPDPFERDLRRALNLGHTFAHPLETQLGYERILHGEAVGWGLALATAVARRRGVCDDATAARIHAVLAAYGLPPRVPRDELRAALRHVHAVRLVRANQLHFVLPERIGAVRIVPEVAQAELEAALDEAAASLAPARPGVTAGGVLGVDVGGTKLLAVLADAEGRIRRRVCRPTPPAFGPARARAAVAALAAELAADGLPVAAVGIGFPGLVDAPRGVVRSSVILPGWSEVPLAAELSRALGVPCVVDNDVNAAARAEVGVRGAGDMLFVAVGTGIGGALVLNGELWYGAAGVAGEIGHVSVAATGPRCACGRRGCVNLYASGRAVDARLRGLPGAAAPTAERTAAVVARAGGALGRAVASVLNVLNLPLVVLGGGVAERGEAYRAAVHRAVRREAFPEAAGACRVELARAGYGAGALGAALLARRALRGSA